MNGESRQVRQPMLFWPWLSFQGNKWPQIQKSSFLVLYEGRFLANDSKPELKMKKMEPMFTRPTTQESTLKISSNFEHKQARNFGSSEARRANHANFPLIR